jgi:hypothetical protein
MVESIVSILYYGALLIVSAMIWQVCLLGLITALGIPALAWVENSALFFLLITAGVAGLAAVLWRHRHKRTKQWDLAQ